MGYVTDETAQNGSYEQIYSYRTSNGGGNYPPKKDCAKTLNLYNPFDFDVDWRKKYVKHKQRIYLPNGKSYLKTIRSEVPYPYFTFKKQVRTIREWKAIYNSGVPIFEAMRNAGFETKQISLRYRWLRNALTGVKICKDRKVQVKRQHACTHSKFTIDGVPLVPKSYSSLYPGTSTLNIDHSLVKFGAFHPPYVGQMIGDQGDGYAHTSDILNTQLRDSLYTKPVGMLTSAPVIAAITSALWPSSDDFAEVDSSPFIDAAEAASDSKFPLGDPPDPKDAHRRMVNSTMTDKQYFDLAQVVDFGQNTWLWSTLVIEPIISSAVGLMASVQANDDAIEAYRQQASDGGWHQGRSRRFFGKSASGTAQCLGAPKDWNFVKEESIWRKTANWELTYDKAALNAMIFYKLDKVQAAILQTSGVQIAHYFKRFYSSFDTVIHNVAPLSFVFDWFTGFYTGKLQLQDKVYMPISDWKVTMSYSLDFSIHLKTRCDEIGQYWKAYYCSFYSGGHCYSNWVYSAAYSGYYGVPPIKYKYKFVADGPPVVNTVHQDSSTERHEFYKRVVHVRPNRLTSYDDLPADLGIDCLDMFDGSALQGEAGKTVTLSALLWGFLT